MKRSVKARAVAMGAMFLFQAMLSQQAVRAAFMDDGDNHFRFTTDAPNPFTDPVSITVNTLHFAAGAGLEVVGGTHALQMTTTGYQNISIVEGSYITHTSANGAAVDWSNGGNFTNYLGTITGGNVAIRLNASQGQVLNHGSISGTNLGIQLQGTGSLSYVYNYHVMGQAPGAITSSNGSAVSFENCGGWLVNYGLVEGRVYGLVSTSNIQMDIFNQTGGTIRSTDATWAGVSMLHGTLDNSGLIEGAHGLVTYSGYYLNNDGGQIIGTADVGMLVNAGIPNTTHVTNRGLIQAINHPAGAGLVFAAEGEIINNTTGTIRGADIGVAIVNDTGMVGLANDGDILGDTGDGIRLTGNGSKTLTNQDTSLIQGSAFGINHHDGGNTPTVTNYGDITVTHVEGIGVRLRNASYLNNYGDITGGSNVAGIGVQFLGNGNLDNRNGASITGGIGVAMNGGTLNNHAGGVIEAEATFGYGVLMGVNGQINNAGQILADASQADGIRHEGGASSTIFNTETGLIRGHDYALDVGADIDEIWNIGQIISTDGIGIAAHGVSILANDASGTILAKQDGIMIWDDGGGVAYIQNAGSITSQMNHGIAIRKAGSSLFNSGTISGYLNNTDVAGVRTQAAVEINNHGMIYGGNGIYSSDDLLTVNNHGLIHGQNYHGIYSTGGLSLTNTSAGVVRSSGVFVAIANVGAPMVIDNAGEIVGVQAAIYNGGPGEAHITNQTTGRIIGDLHAIYAPASRLTLYQSGHIEGDITTGDQPGDSVSLYTGSTTLGNLIDNGGGGDVILRGSGTSAYGGNITGFTKLYKTGTGQWTLTGNASGITGGLYVNSGTLIVNGTLHIIDGDVLGGATLKGNGTIDGISNGTLFIRSGATLAPGNSIGGLTITNHSLQLQAGSILEIEVTDNASDWIDVEGEVHLAGILSVKDISGGTIANGTQYNFLSAGDGFFGEFSDIIDDSALLDFTVSPNGAFLMLTAVQTANFMDLARTPNELAIAAVLDAAMSEGELDDLIDELIGMSQQQIERAFERLSTSSSGAASQAAAIVIQRLGQDTTQVARNLRMGLGATASNSRSSWSLPGGTLLASAQNDPQVLGAAMAVAEAGDNAQPMSDDRRWNLYVSPFGQFGSMDPGTNRSGYDFSAGGVFGGIDYQLDDNHVVGWSVAYAHTNVDLDGGAGDAKINSVRFGPYLNYTRDAWAFDAALTGGVHWFDQSRNVIVGGFAQTAVNDHMGYDISAHGTLSYEFDLEPWKLTPSFTLQYVHMMEDGYSETGGGAANLTVDDTTYDSLRSILGVRLGRTFDWMNIKVTPEVWAGWAFELLNEQHNIVSGFSAGSGPSFSTRIDGGDRHSAIVGAGAAALLRSDLSMHLRYEADVASSNQTHTFWAGLEWRF